MANSGYLPRPICHHPRPYRFRHFRAYRLRLWSLVDPLMAHIPSHSIMIVTTTIQSTTVATITTMGTIMTMVTIMDDTSIIN